MSKNLSDYQLIEQYQKDKNERSFTMLYKRHEPLIKIYAQKMYLRYCSYDSSKDFLHHYSELSLQFLIAVNKCNLTKVNTDFKFKKRLYYFLRNYNQVLRKYFNSKGRTEQTIVGSSYLQNSTIKDKSFDQINDRMFIENLIKQSSYILNFNETQVLCMFLEGNNIAEIAEKLQYSVSYIRVIKENVSRKIKILLPEFELNY